VNTKNISLEREEDREENGYVKVLICDQND